MSPGGQTVRIPGTQARGVVAFAFYTLCGLILGVTVLKRPHLAPFLVLAAVGAWWMMVRSEAAVLGLAIAILFCNLHGLLLVIPAVAAASVLVRICTEKKRVVYLTPQLLLTGAFVILYGAHSVARGALCRFELIALGKILLLYFVTMRVIDSPAALRRIVVALLLAGVVVALQGGIADLVQDPSLLLLDAAPPPPNKLSLYVLTPEIARKLDEYGSVMAFLVIVGMGIAWSPGARSRRGWWLAALVVLFLSTLLSLNRSAYVGLLAVAVVILCGRSLGRREKRGILLLLLLAAPFVPWRVVWPRAATLVTGTFGPHLDYAWSQRLLGWRMGWAAFCQNPLLGVGVGSYVQPAVQPQPGAETLAVGTYSHMAYLGVAAETGLAGFLLFFALLVRTFADLRAGGRRFRTLDPDLFYLCGALQLAFLAALIDLFAEPDIFLTPLWLIVIWSAAVRRMAEKASENSHDPMRA